MVVRRSNFEREYQRCNEEIEKILNKTKIITEDIPITPLFISQNKNSNRISYLSDRNSRSSKMFLKESIESIESYSNKSDAPNRSQWLNRRNRLKLRVSVLGLIFSLLKTKFLDSESILFYQYIIMLGITRAEKCLTISTKYIGA